MSIRLLPLLCAMALAGCGSTHRHAAVTTPFTGTWHQASAAHSSAHSSAHSTAHAAEPLGFLAISDKQVLFNLDGLPRGLVAISDNGTDAGLRSGRLTCDDGRILYVAVGDSLTTRDTADGRLLTPTLHLDVHIFAPGAGAGDAPQKVLRLWPSAALAVASLPLLERPAAVAPVAAAPVAAAPVAVAPVAVAPVAVAPAAAARAPDVAPGSPVDRRFAAMLVHLGDPFLASIADRLIGARSDGLPLTDLDQLYRRATTVVRNEILRDLDSARRGDSLGDSLGEKSALTRVDARLAQLATADSAYGEWRGRP